MSMKVIEALEILENLRQSTAPGKSEDGSRIHIHYTSFGEPSEKSKEESKRADELGLPRDRYTGKIDRVWRSQSEDNMLTMLVELERERKYRSFNLDKGEIHRIEVLDKD